MCGMRSSGVPAAAKKNAPATIRLFMNSKTRNCEPLLGATLRQLAPLPLNRPFHPSAFQALSNSSIMVESPPLHIITVDTISSGAHA